jgi:hypothetical protein
MLFCLQSKNGKVKILSPRTESIVSPGLVLLILGDLWGTTPLLPKAKVTQELYYADMKVHAVSESLSDLVSEQPVTEQ